ncbi:MAG: hypothetical protein AAF671_11480 [Pseudomonadota bacterium]
MQTLKNRTSQKSQYQKRKPYRVTDSSSGMGLEVAAILAEKGADIVNACRSLPKADAVKKTLGVTWTF